MSWHWLLQSRYLFVYFLFVCVLYMCVFLSVSVFMNVGADAHQAQRCQIPRELAFLPSVHSGDPAWVLSKHTVSS